MNILISGASTGIGLASALHLARRGATVYAGVRDAGAFARLETLGVADQLRPIYLDVTDADSVTAAIDRVRQDAGTLDALVNNAGIAIGGPVEVVDVVDWRRQFEVNVFGMVNLTRSALPMLRASRGRVVNISSISGRMAFPFLAPYAASKYAVEAFSDSLRRELRAQGVRVALIEPGAIATPLWEKSVAEGVNRVASLAPPLDEVYGPSIARFNRVLDRTIRQAAPVDLVVRAVDHALNARSPRRRYLVGRGIGVMAWLHDRLPAWAIDRAFD